MPYDLWEQHTEYFWTIYQSANGWESLVTAAEDILRKHKLVIILYLDTLPITLSDEKSGNWQLWYWLEHLILIMNGMYSISYNRSYKSGATG